MYILMPGPSRQDPGPGRKLGEKPASRTGRSYLRRDFAVGRLHRLHIETTVQILCAQPRFYRVESSLDNKPKPLTKSRTRN